MNVREGLGISFNYEHRGLSTQCYQDVWVAHSRMGPQHPSSEAVTEDTEHRAGGVVTHSCRYALSTVIMGI